MLQLYCLPLVKPGGGTDGAQHHPQGGPYDRAIVEGQVVAEVPGQVVPKTAMEHDLEANAQAVNMFMFVFIFTSFFIVPLVVRWLGWTLHELCR